MTRLAAPPGGILTSSVSTRRRVTDRLATALMTLSFVVALVPLALVVGYLVSKGLPQLSIEFLTEDIPRQYRRIGGGMGPAVVGTLLTTGLAALLAVPLGILGAIYLNEFGRRSRFARLTRMLADVMTGVPSVVMGLFVYAVWVVRFDQQSAVAGALALGALMLPVVIRATEEMLRLVPDELRHGSLALGARNWRTIVAVVLPSALPGIVSGSMLAIARAAGETAPLLFTIGVVYRTNWDIWSPNTALSTQIFRNASQPFPGAVERAWGAAIALVLLVFVLTLAARLVASRFSSKAR